MSDLEKPFSQTIRSFGKSLDLVVEEVKLRVGADPEVDVSVCIERLMAAHEEFKEALRKAEEAVADRPFPSISDEEFNSLPLGTRAKTILKRIYKEANEPKESKDQSYPYVSPSFSGNGPICTMSQFKSFILSRESDIHKCRTSGPKTTDEILAWARSKG